MFKLFRKPDTDMQVVQPDSAALIALTEAQEAAKAYEEDRDYWRDRANFWRGEHALVREEIAALKAARARSNANLMRGSKPKVGA